LGHSNFVLSTFKTAANVA